jgi:hypothetical protein
MGSPERLNYTVLGETVNLASRLCGAADSGQILVSGQTATAAGADVVSLGGRALKGFSGDVEVFSVADAMRSTTTALVAALALGLASFASPLAAQESEGGLPTLQALSWISPSGAYQLGLSGRLDLEAYAPGDAPAGLLTDVDPFAAGRMRLFLDGFAGERVYGSAELRVDRGETPAAGDLDARIEQAFLRVALATAPVDVEIQAGKFVSPFGGYPSRHHTVADVFIRPPLPYDVHTVVSWTVAPPDATGFLTWRDRPDEFRAHGAPPMWNVPYQWGAVGSARGGSFDARFGVMNSVPSSLPSVWGWRDGSFEEAAWVAGAGWSPSPALRLGASWTRGPYLQPLTKGALPAGSSRGDFDQQLWGLEGSFSRGPVVIRTEVFRDRWASPNVADDAVDLSGYLEAQSDLTAGLWIAARVAAIHYGDIADGAGRAAAWDYDSRRLQLSTGYRLVRNAELKLEWMRTTQDGPLEPPDDLFSAQLWWSY